MNVHTINANRQTTLATLVGGGTGAGVLVPSATVGLFIDETTAGASVAIQVSNDNSNFADYVSPVDLSAVTVTSAYVIDIPFKYMRAVETADAGGAATIYMSW